VSRNYDLQFDVIVVGGGPAGSTAATFIAMQGRRVLLLEKHRFPIHKIGESLLPATVHGICKMLGVAEDLKQANFMRKLGGTFRWGKSAEPWTFYFSRSPRMQDQTSYAYQVERMKFDTILLDNARKKGVDVREEHAANGVVFDDNGRVEGLQFKDNGGRCRTCRARYIVDASGHQTLLGHHLGERVYSKFFQNIALYGYFRNGKRLPKPNQGNIFSVAFEYGWFWYIPLTETLTSVGAVIGKEYASRLTEGHEAAMDYFISRCPIVSDFLSAAERVKDGPYGELRVRKDFSYCHTKFWRPGLVLIGDSACFIDPVFSSGVHLATYSALLAARSINTCLQGRLDEARCFLEFEQRYRREYGYFYDFLVAFYDVDQDLDSYYWHARKVINSQEEGNKAFIDLVAGLGGSGERLYSSHEEFLRERQGLGAMLFPEASPGNPVDTRRQEFFRKLTSEIIQVQTQAVLKERRLVEEPLFPGGLIPSPDGLHWSDPLMLHR
jgi:FAD-dependent halogenase